MVNRCICYDVPFWSIAELARQGQTFQQICEKTNCCRGCSNCEPYVRVVIKTLAHSVPVMSIAQQNAVMAEARGEAAAVSPSPPDRPGTTPPSKPAP